MSTVKITELPIIPALNKDTTQTLFPAVDVVTNITGQLTAKTLAASLYSNDVLNVGNTAVILPNVVAQFANSSDNYVQINLQNDSSNGSADYVITADTGTDSTYYIDMGYNGSKYNYDGYTYANPLDGYLIVQGLDNTSPGGNLVIGTTTAGKDVSILVGSIDQSRIMSKFVANTGFKMLQYPIFFADGTSQNTAAATIAQTNLIFGSANAAFLSSNTVGTYANAAFGRANAAMIQANNAWTKANSAGDNAVTAITNAATADGKATSAFIAANTGISNASDASSYANSAFNKANNALANTTGTFDGSLSVNGTLSVNDGGLYQYTTSNNTTVTQLTNKSTAVYSNGRTGQITTNNASLAKGVAVTFTVNNSQIVSANDVPMLAIASGATTASYAATVTRVTPGAFDITITNNGTGALTDTLVINYAIIRVYN